MQASSTNYQKIIQLIHLTNTQQVNQAQSTLQQFAINDPNLLLYLTSILKDTTIEENTKWAASTYINHLFSQNSRNYNKQQLLYQLINILQDMNIDAKFKRTLQRGIINIIDQLPQPYITQLRQLIFSLIKQQKLRDTAYLLIACFCIPQTIDMQHIIYLTRNLLPLSLTRIILPNSKQSIYIAKQYNQILKTWIVAWDKLVKQYQQYLGEKKKLLRNNKKNKIKQPNFQSINLLLQLTQSQQLTSVILSIYPWMCQSPMFICTQHNLQQLNILKQQAAALHYRMLKICNRKSYTQNKILNSTTLIIPNIINNLILIVNNNNILDQYICRDYIVNMIKILTQYFICKPNTFNKDWKQLLSTIIFPLIKPNDQQHDMFINNPTQFVSIFEDSTQKQTYGILKTQICRLLQKIGDKSEALSQKQFVIDFIINFCVDSIKNYFKVHVQNLYGIEYVGLDVAITAISIFSYRLQNHKNKIWQLKSFLNKQFVYALNPYDRTMFYLFLSYNYGQLYPNPVQGSFWIQIALQQNSHETTKYCANDFIFNIADQYYSDYFVQCLGNKILTNQQANIWDSLQKLVQTQITKISSALMIQLITNIYTRFELQIKKINNQSKQQIKQTITLLKILQILKTIAQNNTYCKENPNISEMLWKIMLIFDKAVQLEIQDQIFMIVQALIKQQDVISETSKQILVLILNQFAKDQYYQLYFYKIISQFIIKSTSQIILPILKCLQTGMIYHALSMGQSMRKSQRRLLNSHLLLLLQNLLAIHGKILTSQQIIQISAVVMRYIPNQKQKIDCGVVLARALNVLILCHMYVKTDNTWYYIKNYVCKQIYHNYDIVVLIACIKAEIVKQTNVNIIAEMIVIIADAIRLFRKKQKLDQTAQKIKAKYGKDNRLKLVKYKEFQQILKYIQIPFKMQNKQNKLQVQLADLLLSLKQANKDLYHMMFSYIPQEKAAQICELCELSQTVLYNKRPKFSVLKPKAPQLVQKQQNQQYGMKNSQNEDDEGDFKRKRIQNKKKKKENSKKTIME